MKKLLGIAILSIAVMSLAIGCGDSDTTETTNETGSNVETSSQSNTDGNKANTGKVEEPVKEEKETANEQPKKAEEKKEEVKEDNSNKSENSSEDNAYITEVSVYATDDQVMQLKKFSKSVKVYDKRVAAAALEALKSTDWPAGYVSAIPQDLTFTSVSIDNGHATVKYNYNGAGLGTAGESAFVAAVVMTLTEFQTIHGVSFESTGTPAITHMSEEGPFTRGNSAGSFEVIN